MTDAGISDTRIEVSVVIVNFNGAAFLQTAINSLKAQTFQNFELIIFDNASSDGSAQSLSLEGLPHCQVILHTDNIGFAAGNNRAAQLAVGKWLVLMNPDVEARPDWLEKLMAAAAANPGIQTFASAQLQYHDASMMDGAGDAYLLFGFPWRGGFERPASELPPTGYCFSGCGAAAMYDLGVFREAGGFDERFFCYCEDVDLGFRLQLMGYDCLFVSDAIVHHVGSGISGKASPFATYHGTRNRVWTYCKNMPLFVLILTFPGHALLTAYVVIHNLFTSRRESMVRGLKDGLAGAMRIRASDEWKVRQRRIGLWALIRKMAWNPFRMHTRRVHVRRKP